jgi:N4-gp56 family major capsid protein
MPTALYGDLTAEQRKFYELQMLPRAVPPFSHLYFGQSAISSVTDLPENKGDKIDWRLLAPFAAVTTPLNEGVTPNEQNISISNKEATVEEYGAFVRYTRKLAAMGIDKVAAEASDALGEQAGDSLDILTRNALAAGTAILLPAAASGLAANITAAMPLTAVLVLKALATLKNAKAVPGMSDKYVALIHPFAEYDLYQDNVLQNVLYHSKERGEDNAWTTGYIGDAFGVSFWCTPNARVDAGAGAGGANIYDSVVLGKGAFGIGGLGAYMPQAVKGMRNGNNTFAKVRPLRLIQKPFGSAGSEDPLEQRATIAWYTTFTAKVLVEGFMLRVRHGATLG